MLKNITKTTHKTVIETDSDTSGLDDIQKKTDAVQEDIAEVFKKHGLTPLVRIVAFEHQGHLSAKLQGSKRDMLMTLLHLGESM